MGRVERVRGGDKEVRRRRGDMKRVYLFIFPGSSQGVTWEYKGADGSMHGPYTSANMRDWRAQVIYLLPSSPLPLSPSSSSFPLPSPPLLLCSLLL